MGKHGSVKLTVFSICGGIVFQQEGEKHVQFLGKDDDGYYLPSGTYMWHCKIKSPEHLLKDSVAVQKDPGAYDSNFIKTGLLFVSRAEGRIHFVSIDSPAASSFSIAETADNIGANRSLIYVALRED